MELIKRKRNIVTCLKPRSKKRKSGQINVLHVDCDKRVPQFNHS